MASMTELVVETRNPVLVAPAGPTPHEFKYLSDIDDQPGLRITAEIIQYYKNEPGMVGKDPASVIKEALAKVLVFYHPFAGRLREVPGSSKLMVECTGEGVTFVEGNANVTLEQLGDRLPPPLPWLGKFLIDVPGPEVTVGSPLLMIQVTRLACGGFVMAVRLNHTMADGDGLVQILHAVGELAHGMSSPTVHPAWERHLLTASHMPQIKVKDIGTSGDATAQGIPNLPITESVRNFAFGPNFPFDQLVHRSFFFRTQEVTSLRGHLPDYSTTFEVVAAASWRSRTVALNLDPDDVVFFTFLVNCRPKHHRAPPPGWPSLPVGYYGNAVMYATAISKAGELCKSPLGYAVQLVKEAKSEVFSGSVDPVVDSTPLMMAGVARVYIVSDNTHTGFDEVDYGWGKPVFGSLVGGNLQSLVGVYVPFKSSVGEKGVVVPILLPKDAMERFVVEIEADRRTHNRTTWKGWNPIQSKLPVISTNLLFLYCLFNNSECLVRIIIY